MKQRIIDAHMHPDFNNKISIERAKQLGINFNLKGLLKDFKKYNIIKAVAIPRFTHIFSKEKISIIIRNDEIKKLVLENGNKFIGACMISPTENVHEDINMIENDIKKGIFKAIKLFPGYEYFYPNQEECTPIYELAERNNIPVMFHTGDTGTSEARLKYSQPLNIDDVAVSFPKVKFVICHLGNPWIIDALEVVYKNKNVYADISALIIDELECKTKKYYQGVIDDIKEGICYGTSIIEKLMFGTDYPLVSYDLYINLIKKLNLSKKEFNKIFFENATNCFNIKS